MTGLAKALCMLAFIAVAVMHPAGHSYCTTTNTFCSMSENECCANDGSSSCEEHSERQQDDPCCVEIGGGWQLAPGSALVSLPEPQFLGVFVWDTLDGIKMPNQIASSNWHYGGIDPPPRLTAAHALFCVRLI